jgi:hypothetical protein
MSGIFTEQKRVICVDCRKTFYVGACERCGTYASVRCLDKRDGTMVCAPCLWDSDEQRTDVNFIHYMCVACSVFDSFLEQEGHAPRAGADGVCPGDAGGCMGDCAVCQP